MSLSRSHAESVGPIRHCALGAVVCWAHSLEWERCGGREKHEVGVGEACRSPVPTLQLSGNADGRDHDLIPS
jgi:hypothetical protein